ncbi:TetR/AcrR family transcriptional regulator [Mycobacterium sp.]|uniref:TetR/AcrR family transcriptional regulator n=1 Tax=Mycobacterium sp. TaxID=1785 RepID=UPI002C2330DB|nr:TetR/AcrR family transcriptional regulator [Mycobacterium sp.]HTQ17350.1 TetR/AcrR family transcriptional regulator [Mycobacterium sp.]
MDDIAVRARPRRTQAERRAAARNRLLQAAAELIAECGLAAVTLAQVGERAGYSRGIANHHFGTKAALIEELISQVEREFVTATAPLQSLDASVDALVTTSSIFIGLLEDLPPIHRAFLVLWASAVADDELRGRMAASDAAFREAVTAIVERGKARGEIDHSLDADTFAVLLLGQLRGLALQHLIAGDEIELADVRRGLEAAIRGLLTKGVAG